MHDKEEIIRRLDAIPKQPLGFFPTPIHKLERLSHKFGVNIYIKRDDFCGKVQFSGNKMRKLEYFLGDALAQGADTIITVGPNQSNHAMQTVCSCRACGLTPVLFLLNTTGSNPEFPLGNMLINEIMDAEIHVMQLNNEVTYLAMERTYKAACSHAQELAKSGSKPYAIPAGGTSPVGDIGNVFAIQELMQQMKELQLNIDYIIHPSGTGGMHAGLVAGKSLFQLDARIFAFRACDKPDDHATSMAKAASEIVKILGVQQEITVGDIHIDPNYYSPGYDMPNEVSDEAIKLLAKEEGILVDPVYGGKAFAGMIDYIRKGIIPRGSNVLYWHTGGISAYFAERSLLGNIL